MAVSGDICGCPNEGKDTMTSSVCGPGILLNIPQGPGRHSTRKNHLVQNVHSATVDELYSKL